MSASRPAFQWDDALLLDDQLTQEERMIKEAEDFAEEDKKAKEKFADIFGG